MKTKHTKGEWIVYEWKTEGIDFYHIRIGKKFTDLITTVHRWKGYIDKRECKANAKLIAAAPELLEACHKAMELIRFQNLEDAPVVDEIEKAIKKATE